MRLCLNCKADVGDSNTTVSIIPIFYLPVAWRTRQSKSFSFRRGRIVADTGKPSFDHSTAVTMVHAGADVHNLADSRRHSAGSPHQPAAGCVDYAGIDRAVIEARVTRIISERRERLAFFPSRRFADPAWEILLTLTLAQSRQHRLDTTKLCQRVDVPPTTALRWINTMVDEGLLVRLDDVNDLRRKYVELSPEAWAKMGEYVAAIRPSQSRAA